MNLSGPFPQYYCHFILWQIGRSDSILIGYFMWGVLKLIYHTKLIFDINGLTSLVLILILLWRIVPLAKLSLVSIETVIILILVRQMLDVFFFIIWLFVFIISHLSFVVLLWLVVIVFIVVLIGHGVLTLIINIVLGLNSTI